VTAARQAELAAFCAGIIACYVTGAIVGPAAATLLTIVAFAHCGWNVLGTACRYGRALLDAWRR
jgi:hypothetical protein